MEKVMFYTKCMQVMWLFFFFVYMYANESCQPYFDGPFTKTVAENSKKLKLKTNSRNRESTFTLVTLQSFGMSGVIPAEKMLS